MLALVSLATLSLTFVVILIMALFFHGKKSNDVKTSKDIIETLRQRSSRVALVSVMHQPVDLPIWLKHHRKLGIERFYIRLEDSPAHAEYIRGAPDVYMELGEKNKGGKNYHTIMDRQKTFVDKCIKHATEHEDRLDFIFNIDCDELLVGNLMVLDKLDQSIKCVHLKNAEAVYDGTEENCFASSRFRKCSLDSKCRSYINGKGGGRCEVNVTQAGPHYFAYDGAINGAHQVTIPFSKLSVLHFDSCSFAAWSTKFMNMRSDDDDNMPFSYYNESIHATANAYEVYKKHTIVKQDEDDIIKIEHYEDMNEWNESDLEEEEVVYANPRGEELMDLGASDALKSLQVICINLEKNKKKWSAVKKSFRDSDLPEANATLWHFKAIIGVNVDIDKNQILSEGGHKDLLNVEARGYRTHHHQLSRGGIGCFLSHWMIFEELSEDPDNDLYLIVEDDIQLPKNFMASLKKLRVPEDWDVILLGTHRLNASPATPDMLHVHGFWGTHGYLINKRGAHKCINEFRSTKMDAQIDSKMSWMTHHQDIDVALHIYATKKQYVTANEDFLQFTDIQLNIKENPDSYYYKGIKLLS